MKPTEAGAEKPGKEQCEMQLGRETKGLTWASCTTTGRTSDVSLHHMGHDLQMNLFQRMHGIILAVTTLSLLVHASLTSS